MFDLKKNIVQPQERETDYWCNQLKNTSPLIDLGADRGQQNISLKEESDYQENSWGNSFVIAPAQNTALKRLAHQENVSLATVLFTAFQVLLYRYSQQADLLVGYTSGQRSSRLNILPIRTVIEEQLKFTELLTEIAQNISAAYDHANLEPATLIKLFAESNPGLVSSSISPILFKFPSCTPTEEVQFPKISAQELVFEITPESSSLICQFNYDPRLFHGQTIQRIGDYYQTLLQSIVANPQAQVNSLSLISPDEASRILYEWNQTEVPQSPQCIHQLFETRVKENSAAVAVICGGQELSYGELNQQANQLAHYLQRLGVKPGSLVGLCLERSLEMVIAVMAILKAGGAYVPLDIDNPQARLAFILEDAQVKTLLTQTSLSTKLPAQIHQTICLDGDYPSGTLHERDLIAACPLDNLNLDLSIDDLAHIVYTSGSTGKPKGVMLTHGNLSHYAQSLQLALDITPDDVYLHRGSIALIVSARQLLMPLAQGATAVVVTKSETKNPLDFFALIKNYGVTIVDHVPSFWRNFWGILNLQSSDFRDRLLDNQVRLVAAGGEQVTPEIYQCWREIFPPEVKLANIYGQTEGTGVVTMYPIPPQIDSHFRSLPVGRPIANMKVYLLDEDLEPVPIGVTAEIHISGAGVARGYLNRPELTEEKFVPNPHREGDRLYKTGDLGRYLHDGSIQFLGRADRQVNIQGLRIELGEIEAVLSQSELVIEAAVTVRENNLGETLVAFIVSSSQQVTVDQLRSYLEQEIPSYMIPSTFILVDSFPLTTSGKVDRRALANLHTTPASPSIIPPSDPLEKDIVQMLQDILGIDNISTQDDFIELGGNSLLAARLVTEIEHKYGQKIAISEVFQASTPATLANLLHHHQTPNLPQSCIPIKQGHSHSSLIIFGVHNLGYGLEFYLPLAKHLPKNISLYGLSSSFSDNPHKPHFRDVVNSAEYYVDQIRQIQTQGPYYLVGVSFGGVVAYEIAQILVSQGEEVEFLGLLDTYYPHQNGTYKPSLRQRLSRHLQKISSQGVRHILDRIKWRIADARDRLRSNLYQIDWVRDNLVDCTSRDFAQTIYLEQKKEQEKINQDYVIQPYPGQIHMFRATEDIDPKLEWQKLAQSGLLIHDIPGEHLGILQEPCVQVLGEKITSVLEQS